MVQLVTSDREASRKRLPAYGRDLLAERRAGRHPASVTVVYGEQFWKVPGAKLAVKPSEYVPGTLDWRVVAGVRCLVMDLDCGAAEVSGDPPVFGKFYALLAELAAARAYVEVEGPAFDGRRDLESIAASWRYATVPSRWPVWWSDALDALQAQAFLGVMDDRLRQGPHGDGVGGRSQ